MRFKRRNSATADCLSSKQYFLSGNFWFSKELWLSIFLSVLVFAINFYMVWLMKGDSAAITFLLMIFFTLSTVWRLADFKDKEGWYLIIIPLGDVATVILALACVSTIAAKDFNPALMKPVLEILAGIVCGVYGFSLCKEILAIEFDRSKRK